MAKKVNKKIRNQKKALFKLRAIFFSIVISLIVFLVAIIFIGWQRGVSTLAKDGKISKWQKDNYYIDTTPTSGDKEYANQILQYNNTLLNSKIKNKKHRIKTPLY